MSNAIKKFTTVVKLINNRPGLRQTHIVKITGYSKSVVSKLCSQAVTEGFIKVVDNQYYLGEIFTKQMEAVINVA